MELIIEQRDVTQIVADALIIGQFKDQPTDAANSATAAINTATSGQLTQQAKDHDFTGDELETLVLHTPANVKAKHVVVIGLGKQEDFSAILVRKAAAQGLRKARELKAKTVALPILGSEVGILNLKETSRALAEGLIMGGYQFNRYKTVDAEKLEKQQISTVSIIDTDPAKLETIEQGAMVGEAVATAILNARDIVNEPPSKIKPAHMAKAAEEIASLSERIKVTVLDEKALKAEGFNAILTVAAGSDEKPYLIHLHYTPANARGSIAFVGKGVTFDSGGLGIKPWHAMLNMKSDMAGAAAVLGIFQSLAEMETIGQPVPMEVHGVIAVTENMISGKAMKPDDIIETRNGKTIEIIHTDAEGRLILADALTYATEQNPDCIVDFATLTGAAIVALGMSYAAYMGNNPELIETIRRSSEATGELAWQLPLPKEYKHQLESQVADLQNTTPDKSSPDTIFGGLFLQEFVNDIPWAHIDIAGPAFENQGRNPVYPKGGTGFGILLGLKVLDLLSQPGK